MKLVKVNNTNNFKNINKDNLLDFLIKNPLKIIDNTNPPVSFDKTGKPLSYWNDEKWDYSQDILNTSGKQSILNVGHYNKLNDIFFIEFKYLTLITYIKYHKNYSSSDKIKNIAIHLYSLMIISQSLGHSSFDNLSNEIQFEDVMKKISGKYSFKGLLNIISLLRQTNEIETTYFNLNIKFPPNIEKIAAKYSKTQSDYVDQTLYIPTKIHSKLIGICIQIIEEKIKYLPNMMALLEEDYLLYEKIKKDFNIIDVCSERSKSIIGNAKRISRTLIFKKHNLEQFHTMIEINKEIRLLSIASIILILNFSGMRINEVANIKTDGFKIINSDPNLYILRSYETKISGGQLVDYITSPIVKDAFETLKTIHALVAKYDSSVDSNLLINNSKHQKLRGYGNIESIATQLTYLVQEYNLVIDKEDVKESELLNGPREDIKAGELWPLLSHQFRRTLIVNFVSHRLGTIEAVKTQVKHMYATMTEYYAKNSRLAETFNLNVVKEISDIIEEELFNEGVRQYKDFYYSDEPLYGIKGQEIMKERESIKVLSDDEIKQLFKTGLYKISKSMYGYCTKGNLCDKKEAIDPTFCGASCSTMIITKENADNWQKLYFRNHKLLNSASELSIGGIPMNGAKTTMQSQNEVAKKIMDQFNMKYED